MYPSSSSSSSQRSNILNGLTRYGSAPCSFLTSAVDSVIGGADRELSSAVGSPSHSTLVGHYFSGDSSQTSESICKVNSSTDPKQPKNIGLQRSHGFNEIAVRDLKSGGSLFRQRSSPAKFLNNFSNENAVFTVTRGSGSYSSQGGSSGGHEVSRLNSQLSFTRRDSLSQISEVSENDVDHFSSDNGLQNATHSFSTGSFGTNSWENANSIVFSVPQSKGAKNIDGDIFSCLNSLESQFSLPQASLEMATIDKLLHIPEDSVPCKIRAKRGCATHPRSIAERERRTRISGKLKKLQDLVPNMDKQTSYADMLDLAVQHIKGLQNQVQKLHNEFENCTCGCKPSQ
ncbi:HLH domain-containing protein [Cephalotus follicularis]|uniref:HLH domain-containing protein n=1 Tax=Cephalotus follicularis TaxID=3775 RepID=A0A1Q3ATQ6_CEPFO|nr:HLH domain-containing protein [Cephalotus follicularis]